MRAVIAREPGGPEVLELTDVPDPVAAEGEVLLRVAATAVNRADTLQRRGLYPPPPGASHVIGLECSGEVVAVGPESRTGHRVIVCARCCRAAATPNSSPYLPDS